MNSQITNQTTSNDVEAGMPSFGWEKTLLVSERRFGIPVLMFFVTR